MRTCGEQLARAQEADGQPHDGGLVQVRADAVGQRQLMSQVVEHLGLLAAAAASRVPGLLLTPLRAAPAEDTQAATRSTGVFPFPHSARFTLHRNHTLSVFGSN